MTFQQRLAEDQKAAQKSGDQLRLSVLRLLRSAIHYSEVDRGGSLDDEEVLVVVAKQIKQRRESIEEFKKGQRPDLVGKEEAELAILQEYLPPQASREEVKAVAAQIISEVGARGRQDIGKVMPQVISRFRGKADGRLISEIVQELLSEM
ncbi:MAG: GatB/YqeY domain-containing protein [Dehalococcoidia bacterium]|nr:GatB/YqeY domain-containing protein [Dehalococcoidia bacterium]